MGFLRRLRAIHRPPRTQTQRTIAVIKALGAIAPALVCRDVYYPGAKHLVPILQLLIPGIDLVGGTRTICMMCTLTSTIERSIEDGKIGRRARAFPVLIGNFVKQLCTTTFLIEVSQYIKFGDLTSRSITMSADIDSCTPANVDIPNGFSLASLGEVRIDVEFSDGLSLSNDEEDALLRESTADFPDWIANFIRRVILLFDNLPEEAGGATEGQ
jgi:proteasome activator subunit 4